MFTLPRKGIEGGMRVMLAATVRGDVKGMIIHSASSKFVTVACKSGLTGVMQVLAGAPCLDLFSNIIR